MEHQLETWQKEYDFNSENHDAVGFLVRRLHITPQEAIKIIDDFVAMRLQALVDFADIQLKEGKNV